MIEKLQESWQLSLEFRSELKKATYEFLKEGLLQLSGTRFETEELLYPY